MKKDDAIFNVLRDYIKKSKQIRFEGDGYSDSWRQEAEKRHLSNHAKTPEALKAKIAPKYLDLFQKVGVMNETEVRARYDVELTDYVKHIQIEARVLGDIARNHIIPTAIRYQNILIKNVKGLKTIYEADYKKYAGEQLYILEAISRHIEEINSGITKMIDTRKKANKVDDMEKRATIYCEEVRPYFDTIRYHCDKLEMLVDDQLWPLAKYRELLFTH